MSLRRLCPFCLTVLGCSSPELKNAPVDAVGCYAIATGPVSRWRPSAYLKEPTAKPAGQFYLAPGNEPLRFLDKWGVMLNQDTTQNAMGSSNWRRLADSSIRLTNYQVDWGYTMTWVLVNADSVRGTVAFGGDGLTGRARIVGVRIPCSSLPPNSANKS